MVDTRELLDGLTELTDLLNSGDGGPVGLRHTVDLAQRATGGTGACFVEHGTLTARVVAATGGLSWLLGRPVDQANPGVRRIMEGPRVREFPVEALGPEIGRQLSGQGIDRLMITDALAGGRSYGVLAVGYPGAVERPGPAQRSSLTFLAGQTASLYLQGRGLPIYGGTAAVVTRPGEGYAVIDAQDVVLEWNAAAVLLTTRDGAQVIGRPWPFALPTGPGAIEYQMACGVWIEIRCAPIEGTATRAVTFRRRPDAAGKDDRDLFIALTGHELRTPVTVIRGYADTLAEHWESLPEAERRMAVTVVGQRARELSRLVDRLLNAVSISDAATEGLALLPFDLLDAIRDAMGELNAEHRRMVVARLPEALPKASGDRASLATVLTELVTNAGKYSPERVEVEVSAGADAQTVWFRVADRGVGIRPEHTERAFERFWQLETGDHRRSGGVGLGLYLVRRIVERQHGWVSLRPRHGGGTVAEVRLPRADTGPGEGD